MYYIVTVNTVSGKVCLCEPICQRDTIRHKRLIFYPPLRVWAVIFLDFSLHFQMPLKSNVFHLQGQHFFKFFFITLLCTCSTNLHVDFTALRVLYLSVFSSYCPPVCMPAAGCQPIRPPGQFFQPLTLLQRHQYRQGGARGHQLLPL